MFWRLNLKKEFAWATVSSIELISILRRLGKDGWKVNGLLGPPPHLQNCVYVCVGVSE